MFKRLVAAILIVATVTSFSAAAAPVCTGTITVGVGQTATLRDVVGKNVVIGDKATVTLRGDNNCVTIGNKGTITVKGNGNVVTAGKGILSVKGDNNVVTATGIVSTKGLNNTLNGVAQ